MSQYSFPWPDSSVDYDPQIGDGRKVTAEEYAGYFWHLYGAGVIPLADNELVVTSPGANQISVDTGWAICGGRLYHNDAALALAPASAGAGTTRQDSVILQCDWTGAGDTEQYTVRAIIKEGTAGAPPSLTQTPNVLWEDRLYSYTIDDAGAITGITDARTFATFNTIVDEDNLAASVAGDGLTGGAGVALAVNVDGATIETNADALRVKDGGISTAKIAVGALSADAAGRALMAAAFFAAGNPSSYAFFENAFWTATRLDKFADGIWAASAAGRAKFADGFMPNAKLADDCHRMIGEMIEIAGATLGGTDGRRAVIGGVAHESWVHCDGGAAVNGVTIPDTRDRVIGGASGTNAPASTAGVDSRNLSHVHTIPPHHHDMDLPPIELEAGGLAAWDGLALHTDDTALTTDAGSGVTDMRQATYYVYRFIYVG